MPRHIVVALDLRPESKETLALALELAQVAGADLEILHVAHEGETVPERAEKKVQSVVAEVAREQAVGVEQEAGSGADAILTGGSIAEQIRSMAVRKRADLVIIGRGSIQSGLMERLRANSYDIIRDAPCPVLSV
jgi:nucleotide-binding universal stress UspA family protein